MNFPDNAYWVMPVENVFESLPHGAALTKFIAKDEGRGDFAVEIHGFLDSQGRMIITHEKFVNRKDSK